jgi:hypothetical protein
MTEQPQSKCTLSPQKITQRPRFTNRPTAQVAPPANGMCRWYYDGFRKCIGTCTVASNGVACGRSVSGGDCNMDPSSIVGPTSFPHPLAPGPCASSFTERTNLRCRFSVITPERSKVLTETRRTSDLLCNP